MTKKKTVVLGLSGGVDSAVSAHLLLEQGYEVIGVFMRNWDSELNGDFLGNNGLSKDKCEQEYDYDDALQVGKELGIKVERMDFVTEYWDDVFKRSLKMWEKGMTPNPDVFCNKYVKYGYFIDKVMEKYNPDFISMGHYAKIIKKGDTSYLALSEDKHKDQTYFLSGIKKEVLDKVLFPLQDIEKPQVREIAKKLNLSVMNKKDSTGICFIGERDFEKFLQNYLDVSKGNFVDIETNEVVGQHNGVSFYTIGQRKGLNLGGQKGRYFVVGKDMDKNIIYVSIGTDNKYLYHSGVEATDFNYLVDKDFLSKVDKENLLVKYRHGETISQASVKFDKENLVVTFKEMQRSLTPGQEVVLYTNDKDNICIGGGIITKYF